MWHILQHCGLIVLLAVRAVTSAWIHVWGVMRQCCKLFSIFDTTECCFDDWFELLFIMCFSSGFQTWVNDNIHCDVWCKIRRWLVQGLIIIVSHQGFKLELMIIFTVMCDVRSEGSSANVQGLIIIVMPSQVESIKGSGTATIHSFTHTKCYNSTTRNHGHRGGQEGEDYSQEEIH